MEWGIKKLKERGQSSLIRQYRYLLEGHRLLFTAKAETHEDGTADII